MVYTDEASMELQENQCLKSESFRANYENSSNTNVQEDNKEHVNVQYLLESNSSIRSNPWLDRAGLLTCLPDLVVCTWFPDPSVPEVSWDSYGDLVLTAKLSSGTSIRGCSTFEGDGDSGDFC